MTVKHCCICGESVKVADVKVVWRKIDKSANDFKEYFYDFYDSDLNNYFDADELSFDPSIKQDVANVCNKCYQKARRYYRNEKNVPEELKNIHPLKRKDKKWLKKYRGIDLDKIGKKKKAKIVTQKALSKMELRVSGFQIRSIHASLDSLVSEKVLNHFLSKNQLREYILALRTNSIKDIVPLWRDKMYKYQQKHNFVILPRLRTGGYYPPDWRDIIKEHERDNYDRYFS